MEVQEVSRRAISNPGPRAQAIKAHLDKIPELIQWARRSGPQEEDLKMIDAQESEFKAAKEALSTLNIDIEGLEEAMRRARSTLEGTAQRSFQNNIAACERAVRDTEHQKETCKTSIGQLRATIRSTSGKGMGCLFAPLFFVGGALLLYPLLPLLSSMLPSRDAAGATFSLSVLALAILGAGLGSGISRHFKNRPYREQIAERLRSIDECDKAIRPLRQKAETWKYEMPAFVAWQSRHLDLQRHTAAS